MDRAHVSGRSRLPAESSANATASASAALATSAPAEAATKTSAATPPAAFPAAFPAAATTLVLAAAPAFSILPACKASYAAAPAKPAVAAPCHEAP